MARERPQFGRSKQAVLDALEANIREEMTAVDVSRIARVGLRTAKQSLNQLAKERKAFRRRAVTLHGCPYVWGRWAI